MNFRRFLLMVAATLPVLAACEDEMGELGDPELSISRKSIEFSAEGGSETIVLTSNTAWKLKGYDENRDWLTITPNTGKASDDEVEVTITALPNNDLDRDDVVITFFGNVLAKEKLTISQKGAKGDGIELLTVAEFLERKDTVTTYKLTGRVTGYNSNYVSFDIVDETGSVYVYSVSDASKAEYADELGNGGTITITGTYYWYEHATDPSKSKVEIMKATILDYEGIGDIDPETLEVTPVADFLQEADPFKTCKLSGRVVSYNDSYVSFDIKDETGSVYVYSLDNASKEQYGGVLKNGDAVTILAVYYWYEHATDPSKSKAEVMDARIVSHEPLDIGDVEAITVGEFLEKADEITPYQLSGKVTGFYSGANSSGKEYIGFNLTDGTGSITVYSLDAESMEKYGKTIADGGSMTLVGTYYWYEHATDPSKSKAEIAGATIVSYEAPEEIDPSKLTSLSVSEFIGRADELTPYVLSGTVVGYYTGTNNSGKAYMGFDLKDASGSVTVYSFDAATLEKYLDNMDSGGKVTLYGYYQWYEHKTDSSKSKHEVVNATIVSYEAPEEIDPSKLTSLSVSEFIGRADELTPYVLSGTVVGYYTGTNNSGKAYMGFDLKDASGSVTVYSFDAATLEKYLGNMASDGKVTLYGYYQWYEHKTDSSKSKHEVVNATIVSYEAPVIGPIETISVGEFLNRADESTTYRLTGTVSGFNSEFCSFDLVEDGKSIYVYSCDASSKSKYASVIKNGGTITLTGKYVWYEHKTDPGKSKAEINPATIESYTDPGGDIPPVVDPDKPAAGSEVTVAKFLSMADEANSYQLTGTISGLGATYKDFTLTDSTGSIYIYSLNSTSKSTYGDLLAEGKTVTVKGVYVEYNGKPEIKDAIIVSYDGGEVTPVDPSDYKTATCAEFNAKSASDTNVYILCGTVTQIDNSTNGNLYINDGTASTQIYGTLTAAGETGKFASLDVKVGDVLKVFGKVTDYNGTIEMKNATFISREKGPDHDKVVSLAHSLVSGIAWTKVNKAYDNTDTGANRQSATVNGTAVDNLLKLSTSSVSGSATLTVPSGVTKIGFYAAAWTGGATLKAGGESIKIPANGGCYGNPPYTLELTDSANWFEVEVAAGTVEISADKRVLLIGINAL